MPPSKSESNTKESTGHIRTRKRKWGDRGAYGGKGFESSIEDRKDRLSKKLVHGQKRLVHVLRIAKRFEHQKLGKRISRTKQEGTPVELARLQGELEALKTLDFAGAVEAHLRKTIAKQKDIAISPEVRDHLNSPVVTLDAAPKEAISTAARTVIARLYNYKNVKAELTEVLNSIRKALGLEVPNHFSEGSQGQKVPDAETQGNNVDGRIESGSEETTSIASECEGLGSSQGEGAGETDYAVCHDMVDSGGPPNSEEGRKFSMPLSGVAADANQEAKPKSGTSLEPSHPLAMSDSSSISDSDSPLPSSSAKTQHAGRIPTPSNSTFLPSLMTGYWSGSESGQEDLPVEVGGQEPRKNRMGQRARRELWEKKYGRNANHLRNPDGENWNPERRAMVRNRSDGAARWGSARKTYSSEAGHQKGRSNARASVALNQPGPNISKRRDGPLHPSWEAARKAKEQSKPITFQGKKMVFE